MGNFEKLVVLTVLFLSAIVLAVTLNDGTLGDGAKGDDPMASARERAEADGVSGSRDLVSKDVESKLPSDLQSPRAETPVRFLDGDADAQATGERSSGSRSLLLDSTVRESGTSGESGSTDRARPELAGPTGANAAGAGSTPSDTTPSSSSGSILVATDLRPSALAGDIVLFDVSTPITWNELSRHLYGSEQYVGLLRSYNEEMEQPAVGAEVMVPTRDFSREGGLRPANSPSGSARERAEANRAREAGASEGARYVVQDGDTLSKISKRFYGTAHRWKEIFAANASVLNSPDWVKPGIELVIPGANVEYARGVR